MRYFVPRIRLPAELPPQDALADKLGGTPWGLPAGLWPRCGECGKSQSLLAQLVHHPERLDLGRTGRVLHVFQCNHQPGLCSTWEAASGANACFVLEPEQLLPAPAAIPADAPPADPEVRIVDWVARDDGLDEASAGGFLDPATGYDLDEALLGAVTWSTRLGSVPRWLQGTDEAPGDGWRFVGQLDGSYSFLDAPRVVDPAVRVDDEQWEGRTHVSEGPNLGGGIGYVFLCPDGARVDGHFFWQR